MPIYHRLKDFLRQQYQAFFDLSLPPASGVVSLRRQQSIFSLLNLVIIAGLLVGHIRLSRYLGSASPGAIWLLGLGLVAETAELVWLQTRMAPTSDKAFSLLAWWSILMNAFLATTLSIITDGKDGEYFLLMVVPLLAAAFRLNLAGLVAVIVLGDFLNFLEVHNLTSVSQHFEAGTTSVFYSIVGMLVWLLVNNLRRREAELESARERLLSEEKLAAVGRLSSAIAHEIRNPVAMISSSLAMAAHPAQGEAERAEMFAIAAKEAERLERLTGEFLSYARPRQLQVARTNIADMLNYVAASVRARAVAKNIVLRVEAGADLESECDGAQIQQAVLNLVLNAIDACRKGDTVTLSAEGDSSDTIKLDVVDPAGPIVSESTARLFEPFFTTKPAGTGLGLAIARNIARAHNGDLVLSVNRPQEVCFSMKFPRHGATHSLASDIYNEQNTGRR
jgi:signal transduction histidine kinase